jgi:hypothetical protein
VDATFSIRGGATVGWWNVTAPIARLSVDHNALRLSYFFRDYVFFKSRIVALNKRFHAGLRIEHIVPGCPRLIVFWPSPYPFPSRARFAKLKEVLERFEYDVQGGE